MKKIIISIIILTLILFAYVLERFVDYSEDAKLLNSLDAKIRLLKEDNSNYYERDIPTMRLIHRSKFNII